MESATLRKAKVEKIEAQYRFVCPEANSREKETPKSDFLCELQWVQVHI